MQRTWAAYTAAAYGWLAVAGPVSALEDGAHQVWLEAQDGTRIQVATLQVQDARYQITYTDAPFTDHFLSMRPFRCLEGPDKHWCHVPYPYENARDLSRALTDLEYDLLFLWKGAGDYGINMWNGLYYRIEETASGQWVGQVHEMDMDILAVPPDAGNLRPVRAQDLELADPDSHWLPRLVITPAY